MKGLIRFAPVGLTALLLFPASTAQNKQSAAATAQVDRGRELFEKSAKGTPCATCHQIAGVGTAVGPSLKDFAAFVGPHAIVQSIQMTSTAYVQEVKTADSTFPGMIQQKQGDETDVWDLSQTPPVLRKLASKDIVSLTNNQTWKHPPAAVNYTPQELADIIAFVKFGATGTRKEVKISEVQTSE